MHNFLLKLFSFVLLGLTTSNIFAQNEIYQISNTTLTVEGFGKLDKWHPSIKEIDLKANFLVDKNALAQISDFNLSFLFAHSDAEKDHISSAMKKVLLADGGNEIKLSQVNMMILPIMKIAHFTMDMNTSGVKQFSPLLLNYKVEEDQSISFSGEQTIWLYQFGIMPKKIKETHANDKVVLKINFSLIKSANMIAKSE